MPKLSRAARRDIHRYKRPGRGYYDMFLDDGTPEERPMFRRGICWVFWFNWWGGGTTSNILRAYQGFL